MRSDANGEVRYRFLPDVSLDPALAEKELANRRPTSPSATATQLLISELGGLGQSIVSKFRSRGVRIGMVRDGRTRVIELELGGFVSRLRVRDFKELFGL